MSDLSFDVTNRANTIAIAKGPRREALATCRLSLAFAALPSSAEHTSGSPESDVATAQALLTPTHDAGEHLAANAKVPRKGS